MHQSYPTGQLTFILHFRTVHNEQYKWLILNVYGRTFDLPPFFYREMDLLASPGREASDLGEIGITLHHSTRRGVQCGLASAVKIPSAGEIIYMANSPEMHHLGNKFQIEILGQN